MVFNVNNIKTVHKATVTKNTSQGQANLDFSEKTITNQHNPINNGQEGGFFPSVFAETPTNANGTQADLNFDPKTISNSTNYTMSMNSTGTNSTNPFPENLTLKNPPDYQITPDKIIDNRNLANENTNPPVNNNPSNPSTIGGNRLSQDEYQAMLNQQRQNKTKNFEPTKLPTPDKLELNAKDFFKGTKSGNEVFNPVNVFKNDGSQEIKKVKGYADVDPFGDFSGSNAFSNEKANSKALKKQFDFYKSISNF